MATITNIINSVFKTTGAPGVVKHTEEVGRAQTRLGKESTNTGRAFAAQSQGLGGLVAAYAGAAATSFALQAAFSALAKAAQVENVVKGTNALAAASGQSGPKILKNIQAITQGQLSLAEAASNANLALSSGFNTQQIEQFTNVALKASVALGRDFTDAYSRIIKGSAKLEPELLDELGILTRIDPAMKAYARRMGIAVTAMSQFEKTQAFANAVIEEGLRKFEAIDTTAPSAQKSLAQLQVQISNLATEFGQLVTNTLLPIVKFFSGDLGNTFVLFGGVLLLVFGKAKTIIGDFASSSMASTTLWADNAVSNLSRVKVSMAELNAASTVFAKSVADRGGKAGKDTVIDGISYAKGSGNFSQAAEGTMPRAASSAAAALRTKFMNKETMTINEQKIAVKLLTDMTVKNTTSSLTNGAVLKANTFAYRDSIAMINAWSTAQQSAGIVARGVSASITFMSTSLKLLGRIMSGLFGAFSWIFLISSALDLMGFNVIGGLVDWFKNLGKTSESTASGIVGAFTYAAGGSNAFTESLKRVGATAEDLEKVKDTVLALNKEILADNKVANSYIAQNNNMLPSNVAPTPFETTEKTARDTLARLTSKGSGFTKEELSQIEYLKAAIELYKKFDGVLLDFIGNLANASGISGEQTAKTLDVIGTKLKGVGATFEVFGLTLATGVDWNALNKEQQEYISTMLTIQSAIISSNEAFDAGSSTASSLGQVIGNLRSQYLVATKAYNTMLNSANPAGLSNVQAELARINQEIDDLVAKRDKMTELELIFTNISEVFSKEISNTSKAFFDGSFSFDINTNSLKAAIKDVEVFENRNQILFDTINKTDAAKTAQTQILAAQAAGTATAAQLKNLSSINLEAEIYDKATEAVFGTLLDIVETTSKIVEEQNKVTLAAGAELNILKAQAAVRKELVADTLANLKLSNSIEASDRQKTLVEARYATEKKNLDLIQKQAEAIGNMSADGFNAKEKARVTEILAESAPLAAAAFTDLGKTAANTAIEIFKGAVGKTEEQVKGLVETIKGSFKKVDANNKLEVFDLETKLLIRREKLVMMQDTKAYLQIKRQAAVDKIKIDAEKTLLAAEINVVRNQLDGYATFAVSVSSFASVVVALNDVFKNFLNGLPAFLGATPGSMTSTGLAPADISRVALDSTVKAANSLTTSENAQNAVFDQRIQDIDAASTAALDTLIEKLKNSSSIIADTEATRAEERKLVELELTEATIDTNNAIADLAGGSGELTKLQEKLEALFDSLKGNISTALSAFNDLVFYGEGTFKDIISNMFKTIQQDFFKTTIADPLSETISDSVFGMFGVKNMKKGIENAKVVNGSLLVSITDGPSKYFDDLFGAGKDKDTGGSAITTLTDKFTGFFSNLFGQGGILSKLFGSLFGQTGILSGLFKGIGGLFSGVLSLFASGGTAHLAQGGFAPMANLKRDRIPAFLEPGEFVLRKQAVKEIGPAGIQAMNSGNYGGGASGGDVTVNMVNNGSPKQVEASQPRFDGDRYVIDVVMRDLANNGPIRKSLRGGAI